jgi:hypothetical protein
LTLSSFPKPVGRNPKPDSCACEDDGKEADDSLIVVLKPSVEKHEQSENERP